MDAMKRLALLVLLLTACSTPDALAQAKAAEAANALPRAAFYDTAPDSAAPGTPLRAERFTGWALPEGAVGTRLVYDSRSAQGKPVAASAAVLTPAGAPPSGGWPVIAWAHGTSGVAQQCAPSLMKDLYYGEFVANWLRQGFAVVATDYSGLGAGSGHEYLTLTANANDVRYSVAAARKAVAGLGDRWVVVGHSQGGQTAWGVARQQVAEPVGQFLGSVALAPVTPYDRLQQTVQDNQGQGQYLAYVASSIALQHPGFQPMDMLSEAGMRDYDQYLHAGCWSVGRVLSGTGTPRQLLRADWSHNPAVSQFLAGNRYSTAPLAGPLFVASGATDQDVAASTIAPVVAEQCGQGTPVAYHQYPGDHESVLDQASADLVRWIRDRFAGGSPAPSTCLSR
ncbi:lipase family protein [Kutzneria viridogrisea]